MSASEAGATAPLDLEAIRGRGEAALVTLNDEGRYRTLLWWACIEDDIPALIAEVERLRAALSGRAAQSEEVWRLVEAVEDSDIAELVPAVKDALESVRSLAWAESRNPEQEESRSPLLTGGRDAEAKTDGRGATRVEHGPGADDDGRPGAGPEGMAGERSGEQVASADVGVSTGAGEGE